jgi:DegV family protein with EDD domain
MVRFDRDEFRDGVDISPEEFYGRLTTEKRLPATSQPPADVFADAYRRVGKDGDGVVSIHISSKLSGTLNAASVGRELVAPDIRVELIDSYSVSMGLGLVAEAAAKTALEGGSLDEVTEVTKAAVERVRAFVGLGTVEFLRRGGRISRASSVMGSALNVKPILQVVGGEVIAVERVRTWKRAVNRLAKAALQDRNALRIHVGTSGSPHLAAQFVERLRPEMPHTDFTTGFIGSTVGVYSGPGALGFASLGRS